MFLMLPSAPGGNGEEVASNGKSAEFLVLWAGLYRAGLAVGWNLFFSSSFCEMAVFPSLTACLSPILLPVKT